MLNGNFPFCFQVTFCQSRQEMGAEGDVKVNSFPGPTKNKRRGDGTALGLVKPFPVYRNGQMKEIPEA